MPTRLPAKVDETKLLHDIHYGRSLDYPKAVLEFPILTSAAIGEERSLPDDADLERSEPLDKATFSEWLWNVRRNDEMTITVCDFTTGRPGGEPKPLSTLLQSWRDRWLLAPASNGVPPFLGWRVWEPVGHLMAHSFWRTDMVLLPQQYSITRRRSALETKPA